MKPLAVGLALALVATTPASAWISKAWQCGEVEVTLRKYATNFRFVGIEGAKLNGKPCRPLPWDPSWGEELNKPTSAPPAPADRK